MQPDDGELDITSEAHIIPDEASPRTAENAKQKPKSVRVLFGCCNTYARIAMPERIRNSQQDSWRVHCVRCGKLSEIPL